MWWLVVLACTGVVIEGERGTPPSAPTDQVEIASSDAAVSTSEPGAAPLTVSAFQSAECDGPRPTLACARHLHHMVGRLESLASEHRFSDRFGQAAAHWSDEVGSVYVYPPPVDTPAKMAEAMRAVVSERLVAHYFSILRTYDEALVVSYPGCGGPGASILEDQGKLYVVEMTDAWDELTPEQQLASLPDPLIFVKNAAGAWVLDTDVSLGCWEAASPRLADGVTLAADKQFVPVQPPAL